MRIGIDIDDTLVNTSESFEKLKIKYDLNIKKKFNDKWDLEEREQILYKYLYEIIINAELKENAKEVINELSKNNELFIITARNDKYNEKIPKETIEFFKKENINIDKFYFNDYEKASLAKSLNLDLMIDDRKSIYENMKNVNIDCILFGDKIKTWKEVLEYINSKEGNNWKE